MVPSITSNENIVSVNIGSHTATYQLPATLFFLLGRFSACARLYYIFTVASGLQTICKCRRGNTLETTTDSLFSSGDDSLINPLNSIAAVVFYLSE